MDVQTQDSARASEKEQFSAPAGWTKKLVPASAKSITLRKHDAIFIAPDGQEVKSKWHLSRYLKAHPNGPAPSEFNWSSGEEAPIRRSSRVVATTKEDPVVEKSSTRKKNKRNASEMDSEEAESHKEKPQEARKRAKKAGKSTDLDTDAQDAADVSDEVVDKATACNNEAMDALPLDEDQKLKNETTEAEASKEDVTEKIVEVEESSEVVKEKVVEVEASPEVVTEKAVDEVLDLQGEAVVPNATTDGEVYLSEVTVVEVEEVIVEREVQETDTLLDSLGELKGEQAAMELEQPVEHADDDVMETKQPVEQAEGNITEMEENLEPESEVNEEVFPKVSVVSSVTVASSVVEEVSQGNDIPLDPLKHEEEPLGPLVQKEEQERPATHVEIEERSPSELNGSAVPVNVSNE